MARRLAVPVGLAGCALAAVIVLRKVRSEKEQTTFYAVETTPGSNAPYSGRTETAMHGAPPSGL